MSKLRKDHGIKWKKIQICLRKIKKEIKPKMASPPEQDLHPVWDRFRGTMLYPLSCGELAIPKEQILRLYVTSELHTARNKRSDSEEKVFEI